jgi:hypothetical protein
MDQDEETIRTLGWEFSDWVVMFMTLFFHDEQLAEYLENEHEDFYIPNYQLQDAVSMEVARYLHAMNKDDLRDLYHTFIDKDEIISDLMLLKREERINLIADRLDWRVDDLRRIDFISAN